jgi:hypothetical protein
MSGTHPRSQRYMRLFAYLPLVLRPESENALLIGYGVGVTADALMRDSHLKHLDVVDISKEILSFADFYSGPGYTNPLRDPRVTTVVQDCRFFLQSCPEHYDIITGEPPPLKIAGTVNLYTEQFFSLMKSRLGDGGIVSFWLPLYHLRISETKAILRAFHNVFPNASLWATNDVEWIMIGIKPPLPKPNEPLARRLWSDRNTGAVSAVAHNSAALNAIRPHVIISGGIIADSTRNPRVFFHQIAVRHSRDVIANGAVQPLLLDPSRRSIA